MGLIPLASALGKGKDVCILAAFLQAISPQFPAFVGTIFALCS
jgi:hypothetical protein